MARKLPWARTSTKDTKQTVIARTTNLKRERATTPRDKEHLSPVHTPLATPQKRRRNAGSRSPSTSPPPAQPEVQLMREGYDGDDVYMMVEDEFCSVAQSFTAHLHHAEYKRLMHKARHSQPKTLPELSPSMPREVKHRLHREKLEQKQKAALAELGAGIQNMDEIEDGVDDIKVDDPWSGTSLAGLMSTGNQHKTSLIGLERIPSMSRAAKGYTKGRTDEASKSSKTKDIAAELGLPANQVSTANAMEDDDETRSVRRPKIEFDDEITDLPVPSSKRPRTVPIKNNTVTTAKASTVSVTERLGNRSNTKSRRSLIDELDDFEGPTLDPPSPPPTRSKSSSLSGSKRKDEEKKKDRRSRLDEVPVFMI